MRVLGTIIGLCAGLAGIAAACAADLPRAPVSHGAALYYTPHGVRAGQIWFWAYEPGVSARPYWLPPWRDRHYFPFTGHRPRIGRRENASLRGRTAPARSYTRTWTTTSAFVVERPHVRYDGGGPWPPEPLLK
jgi:hypothetical protein